MLFVVCELGFELSQLSDCQDCKNEDHGGGVCIIGVETWSLMMQKSMKLKRFSVQRGTPRA